MWGKILIIDDDQSTVELLEHVLAAVSGAEIICKISSTEAMKVIEETEFDLVLTDIVMPDIGGLDILKHTKILWPETEVVMLSGLIDLDRAIEALKHHAFDFIEKPVKVGKLRTTVENALGKRRLTAENKAMTKALKKHNLHLKKEVDKATGELQEKVRQLELSSKNQQAILDNMPSGCVVLDKTGQVCHINGIAEIILGFPQGEIPPPSRRGLISLTMSGGISYNFT